MGLSPGQAGVMEAFFLRETSINYASFVKLQSGTRAVFSCFFQEHTWYSIGHVFLLILGRDGSFGLDQYPFTW